VTGTVEDIGIRSTRIRTLNRTIVTIPNSDFSSQQIENFATRDRFLFNPVIGVEYGISSAKLRDGVEIVERILKSHEKIDADGARARFTNFGASSLDIEVFSYITVSDFGDSLVVRQQLLLDIFQQLEAAGLSIAFPTRKVLLVQEGAEANAAPARPS
jgi:MscS family membrane protein